MNSIGRYIGLILTAALFAFSSYVYLKTGDWVAVVFAVGSLGYAVFFLSTRGGGSA